MSTVWVADAGDVVVRVQRARLTGTVAPLAARRRLEAALRECTAEGVGLPPRAWLLVAQLTVQLPQSKRPDLRAGLQPLVREAVRPWQQSARATAPAVWFSEEAELAACVIRDWCQGRLGASWWGPVVLEGRSAPEWWQRHLLPRGDLLPAVLGWLAGRGLAVPWLARLSEAEATAASNAVADAHGLTLPPEGRIDGASATGWRGGLPAVDHSDLGAMVDARARLAVVVPEVEALAGSAPRARLLALALGLQRAPTWVRWPEFGHALRALGAAGSADGRPAAAGARLGGAPDVLAGSGHEGLPPGSPPPELAQGPPRSAAMAVGPDDRRTARDLALAPSSSAANGARLSAAPTTGIAAVDASPPVVHPRDRPTRAEATAAAEQRRGPSSPQGALRGVSVLHPPEVGPGPIPTPQGDRAEHARGRVVRIGSARPMEDPAGRASSVASTPPTVVTSGTPELARDSAIQDVPAAQDRPSRTWHPDAIDSAGRSDPVPAPISLFAESVETAHGGLLYLLNLALALGLYGDFTQPRRPGIALSPWDWLAVIGRAWFGRAVGRDPLWGLLPRLAGRPAGQPPGLGFAPPPDWSIPPDWPLPWGMAGPVGVQRRGDRLRLWHPAGFLLAELGWRAGIDAQGQAEEVLGSWPVLAAAQVVRLSRPPARMRYRRVCGGSARRGMPSKVENDYDNDNDNNNHRGTAGHGRPGQHDLARWLARLLPYLEARLALALGEDDPGAVPALVCRHQALIQVSATALDVHLSLDALPIAIRIAGLDRDPGWIPAAGRSVAFHFA